MSIREVFTHPAKVTRWHEQAATMAPNFWPDLPHPSRCKFTGPEVMRALEEALSTSADVRRMAADESIACGRLWDLTGNRSQVAERAKRVATIAAVIQEAPGIGLPGLVEKLQMRKDYVTRVTNQMHAVGLIRIVRKARTPFYYPVGCAQ